MAVGAAAVLLLGLLVPVGRNKALHHAEAERGVPLPPQRERLGEGAPALAEVSS